MAARIKPHSGLQKQVLGLYRSFLRAVATKPVDQRPNLYAHIRKQFDKDKTLRRMQINKIEHLIRQGEKKLRMIKEPGFNGVATITYS